MGNVVFIRDMPCWFQFANYTYMQIISGRGSTEGRGDAFSPASGHRSVGLAVDEIGFQRELPCQQLLTIRYLQTQQDARK